MRVRRCVRCGSTADVRERIEVVTRTPEGAGDIASIFHPMLGFAVMLLKARRDEVLHVECASCFRRRRLLRWCFWLSPVAVALVVAVVTFIVAH